MIPAPWTIGVRRWSQSGVDAHGNPEQSWADPVAVAVHAVSPRMVDEPADPHRAVVVEGLTVYAPAGTAVGVHDRVLWPVTVDADGAVVASGEEYEVDGDVADWTQGPWPHPNAGVTFDLTRTEG